MLGSQNISWMVINGKDPRVPPTALPFVKFIAGSVSKAFRPSFHFRQNCPCSNSLRSLNLCVFGEALNNYEVPGMYGLAPNIFCLCIISVVCALNNPASLFRRDAMFRCSGPNHGWRAYAYRAARLSPYFP